MRWNMSQHKESFVPYLFVFGKGVRPTEQRLALNGFPAASINLRHLRASLSAVRLPRLG